MSTLSRSAASSMSEHGLRDGRLKDDFYSAGGAISPDAPTYVERQADHDLLEAVLRADYCTVLTARQLGKTSLIYRLQVRLPQGFRLVVIDLQAGVGSRAQFYAALCTEIGSRCGFGKAPSAFFGERQGLALERVFQEFPDATLADLGGDHL